MMDEKKLKRLARRITFHEIGHAVAMYICYGNIERIEEIACDMFYPVTTKSSMKTSGEYISKMYNANDGFQFVFNEVCFLIGGGLCESLFCSKTADKISENKRYVFPIKSMDHDMDAVKVLLSLYGVKKKKEIDAFVILAVRRLFPSFMKYEEKIKLLVNKVLNDELDVTISRMDFYEVFDPKLYRKERREFLKRIKAKYGA